MWGREFAVTQRAVAALSLFAWLVILLFIGSSSYLWVVTGSVILGLVASVKVNIWGSLWHRARRERSKPLVWMSAVAIISRDGHEVPPGAQALGTVIDVFDLVGKDAGTTVVDQ